MYACMQVCKFITVKFSLFLSLGSSSSVNSLLGVMSSEKMSEICDEMIMREPQPLSPISRLFHKPCFNCFVIGILGTKTRINPQAVKHGLQQTLLKHPRFSSKLVRKGRELKWKPVDVDLEKHVLVPMIEPQQEMSDRFVEDYISNLTTTALDASIPLWDLHLLNVSTSDAEAVGIFRIHHSLGDGISLISLLLACTRKTSDPEALPTVPVQKNKAQKHSKSRLWELILSIWTTLTLFWNTIMDLVLFVATILFLRDTQTPVKGAPGVELNPRRFVHRTVSLEDIKLVKHAMKVTINDVLLGVTEAGLSRYINRKFGEVGHGRGGNKKIANNLPKNIRIRAAVVVNIRKTPGIQELADMMTKNSKARWGNTIGYVLLPPFSLALEDDPMEYIRRAKATVDRKKHSLEAFCSSLFIKLSVKLFGDKAAALITYRAFFNTTLTFSNVVGPLDEIAFHGHPISYIAPSVYGHAHALTIHLQSYVDKMTISMAVDPNVISDPHRLCDDIEAALKIIRDTIIKKGLTDMEV